MSARYLVGLVVVAVAPAACSLTLDFSEGIPCSTGGDCIDNYECVGGKCEPPGSASSPDGGGSQPSDGSGGQVTGGGGTTIGSYDCTRLRCREFDTQNHGRACFYDCTTGRTCPQPNICGGCARCGCQPALAAWRETSAYYCITPDSYGDPGVCQYNACATDADCQKLPKALGGCG